MTWRGEPLPRGRHKLSPEVVRTSQRERIVRAMVELVAEHGYAATTVPNVVAAARVSRNAFYEHFTDKTDCFLAVCDEVTRELLDGLYALRVRADLARGPPQGHGLLPASTGQEHPAFSRAYFLELPSAGERAARASASAPTSSSARCSPALAERARAEQPEPAAAAGPRRRARSSVMITELVRRGGPRRSHRRAARRSAPSSWR